MVVNVGADGGNKFVKMVGDYGEKILNSELGEYREITFDKLSNQDIIYEFNGKKGFAGTLAKYESQFSVSRMGDSKAHEELIIRILINLHRYCEETNFHIVVGQPIQNYTKREVEKIKQLLQGSYEIVVNDVKKVIQIKSVGVAREGASAFWSNPQKGKIHVLDVGSGTVNGATFIDGRFIAKDSFTIPEGLKTILTDSIEDFVHKISIFAFNKRWDVDDTVLLCGGGAKVVYEYMFQHFSNVHILHPIFQEKNRNGGVMIKHLDPIYANAVGFYNLVKRSAKGE